MEEPYTELSFGKVIKDDMGEIVKGEKYAVYHWTIDKEYRTLEPGCIRTNMSFDFLAGYIEGSLRGISNEKIQLFNGISKEHQNGYSPCCKFAQLKKEELEELVSKIYSDSSDLLKEMFEE